MIKLTPKLQAFFTRMHEGDLFATQGFRLLLAKNNPDEYFDVLLREGFFDPKLNPAPIEEEPGLFRVPYWTALSYLSTVAKIAGAKDDIGLSEKVLGVIRRVSLWKDEHTETADNYHTYGAFAEIFGLLPTRSISLEDLDLIPLWLRGRFNNSQVAYQFCRGTLQRFVTSPQVEDWIKAVKAVEHLTKIVWDDDEDLVRSGAKPRPIVKEHWVKEICMIVSRPLGTLTGSEIVPVLVKRLEQVFQGPERSSESWIWRPAVEDHEQNRSWNILENCFFEASRDALLCWLDTDVEQAREFIKNMLDGENFASRRVAIYLVGVRFEKLSLLLKHVLVPSQFCRSNIHELYNFLENCFSSFEPDAKRSVTSLIANLAVPEGAQKSEKRRKSEQRLWLSAIRGKGSVEVDEWFVRLDNDPLLGAMASHSDFNSYSTSMIGPGPSPFTPQELVEFARDGVIVRRLNEFVPGDPWYGPTTESLIDSLSNAVVLDIETFLSSLNQFVEAKLAFQYGIINGLKKAWDAGEDEAGVLKWMPHWPDVFGFFKMLIREHQLWSEEAEDPDSAYRRWTMTSVVDFLSSATQTDRKAYPPEWLDQGLNIIKTFLEKQASAVVTSSEENDTEFLNKAINTSKGRTVTALFSHALRASRVSDQKVSEHKTVWKILQPIFDSEVLKVTQGNWEFAAIAGSYVVQLEYLDATWCEQNINRIFSSDNDLTFRAAVGGFTYSSSSRFIYDLIGRTGILMRALRIIEGSEARRSLLQKVGLAYLWSTEELDGEAISFLFVDNRQEDLTELARFFWQVSHQKLEQVMRNRIVQFWLKCTKWRWTLGVPKKLMSVLSLLTCYLDKVDELELMLLLAVVPHLQEDFNGSRFIEQLTRLVDQNPKMIDKVVCQLVEHYRTNFDFDGQILTLLDHLASLGFRDNVMRYCDKLIDLVPGVDQLYKRLVSSPSPS